MRTTVTEQNFDLVAYAKRHRYRLRTLHDGNRQAPRPVCAPACAGRQEIVQKSESPGSSHLRRCVDTALSVNNRLRRVQRRWTTRLRYLLTDMVSSQR